MTKIKQTLINRTGRRIRFNWISLGVFILFASFFPSVGYAWELEPLLDYSDRHEPVQQSRPLPSSQPADSSQPLVLKGSVRSLDAAIMEESDVDWYGWYLSLRKYIATHGGFQCEIGTTITFFRSGHIQAQSYHPACLRSAMGKHFGLPPTSRLSAVTLPVRHGQAPPASKEELYHYIRGR
jgi:hypothetical protein